MAGAPTAAKAAPKKRAPGKSSPDYSPTERLLAEVEELGRSEERKRREPVVAQARRGAARRATAATNKKHEAQRKADAERRALDATRRRKARNERKEAEVASARRGAYASGAAQAKRDAQAQARSVAGPRAGASAPRNGAGGSSPKLSSPTVTILPGSGLSGGIDRESASRIVIVLVGVCAVAVIAHGALGTSGQKVTVQVNGETITVPHDLRSLAGVFVAGTISLLVVEIAPGLGLALGLLLAFDVLANTVFNKGGLASKIGAFTLHGAQPITLPHAPSIAEKGRKPGSIGPPLGNGSPPPVLGKDPVTGKPILSA